MYPSIVSAGRVPNTPIQANMLDSRLPLNSPAVPAKDNTVILARFAQEDELISGVVGGYVVKPIGTICVVLLSSNSLEAFVCECEIL
jgi:hypothetical protein